MKFIQYYLDCLSHASYLIADDKTGRAVVVDPQRDVAEYLSDAEKYGYTIELVIETHFHADFLSGHLELAEATGAKIVYSSVAETEFESMGVADGERYSLGDVTLEFLHTPGHTPESLSIVVYEHADDEIPYGVLTGDTLFIGDVGRPDLLASIGYTREELADKLYDSLHHKLMTLPDATRVYPAHGAGSACGKNLSAELQSTIGEQRRTNYACAPMSEDEFVALVTEGQPSAPGYFVYDAVLNRKNHDLLDVDAHARPLGIEEFLARRDAGAVIVDARSEEDFARGHLRGSLNVPVDGRFAERAGMVVEPGSEIIVVAPQNRELEVITRLGRIGFDTVTGYLRRPEAALRAVPGEVAQAERVTVEELRQALADAEPPVLLDVRNVGEVALGAIEGALTIPLSELPRRLDEVPADRPVVVYCASGSRSSTAASLLRRAGRERVSDLIGGYQAWQDAHAPTAA